MSSLRDLQQRVYRAVVLDEELAIASPSTEKATRLEVYRNNARVTFERTLEATYPVVRELVGEPCFRSIAHTFLREHPSRSGDLGCYGTELPMLLEVFYRDTPFAYLADIARLEAAIAAAEGAADSPSLEVQRLADVVPEAHASLRFVLHPATWLMTSRWPVLAIWRAHQRAEVAQVDLAAGAEHVLVARPAGRVVLRGLDAGTFAFASSLADDEMLVEAVDAGLAAGASFDVSAALASLVEVGVLVDFSFSRH
jgi:hypothetical protein